MTLRSVHWLMLGAALLALPAAAQDNGNAAVAERLDRLERDLSFVQKQVYRGGAASSADAPAAPLPTGAAGGIEVRLSRMDEEIRQLRGVVEQVQFTNRQQAADIKRLSDDVDFRLRALEERQRQAAAAEAATAPAPAPAAEPAKATEDSEEEPAAPAATPAPPPAAKKPSASAVEANAVASREFPSAQAHYTYAFTLLNARKYAEASASFDAFVKKYPDDTLTSNAYYWLGESQYARGDYTRAAEAFRKGFEVNPDGQKAPDNLYKLAKSLGQVKRTREACVVLKQIISKYPDASPRVVQKAQTEQSNLACK